MKKKIFIVIFSLISVTAAAFFIYTGIYCHADATALTALKSDDAVQVTSTDFGYFFDGPSESDVLIFYPGAKVEETAYAPLLHLIALQGMDVCLIKMPFRLAVFGLNRADRVIEKYDYTGLYIGGHSLGGAMAANYASTHSDELDGIVLLAAYSTADLDDSLKAITIYGSEDEVLNTAKMNELKSCLPDGYREYVIEGGNHAQFGNYGIQSGDGEASVSSEEQQLKTAEYILGIK